MGRVIPFSEIESYLSSIASADVHKGTILDTNILISAGYEVRDSHQDVVELLEILLVPALLYLVRFRLRLLLVVFYLK